MRNDRKPFCGFEGTRTENDKHVKDFHQQFLIEGSATTPRVVCLFYGRSSVQRVSSFYDTLWFGPGGLFAAINGYKVLEGKDTFPDKIGVEFERINDDRAL